MKYILIILIFCCTSVKLQGQELYMSTKVGALYYQGDLSPLHNRYSTSQASFGISTGLKYFVSKHLSLYTDVLVGSLKGDDMYAKTLDRRKRNLSFKSYLFEYGLGIAYSFSKYIKPLEKSGLSIDLIFGGNIFVFNPKAYYKGSWVDLQPLGTEGQGWAKGSKPKYDKIALSLSRGISINYRRNKMIIFGIEILHRKTFTDYIDDVSTNYIDYNEQIENSSKLAADLANRMGELTESPVIVKTGSPRGNPDRNDSYLFTSLKMSYKLYK